MASLVDGWEEMDLPSVVNDLTRLFGGYGALMSVDDLQAVAEQVKGFTARIDFVFGNHVPFVTFAFKPGEGEMLVAFPRQEELARHTVRTCKRNGATPAQCSDIGTSFIETFVRLVLPSESHAAETLER